MDYNVFMVNISQKKIKSEAIRFSVRKNDLEVARGYVYLIKNDLNEKPYALLEDVFVDESCRGEGVGTELIDHIIQEVKKMGCYKLIATSRLSREKVHKLYEKIGFENYGIEFRMNLDK